MVKKDFSALNNECSNWRQALHNYRDELHRMQQSLESSTYGALSREKQSQLERLQNQLHVQLMNVHDLRQAVKRHDAHITYEIKPAAANRYHQVSAYHENLNNSYRYVAVTINVLKSDLQKFINNLQ